MDKKQNSIDDILFEIARTMEYCRRDSMFPESAGYKEGATGYFNAKPDGRLMDMGLIEWKGGQKTVVGGDWYEIPSLLLELSRMLATSHGAVKRFSGEFSPQDVLTLQARGKDGPLGQWTLAYQPITVQEAPELLEQAEDVSGVPECIVSPLRKLNEMLRSRMFPLRPKADIPVKFWNIADPLVQWTALQYLYPEILASFDYDDASVPPLPPGYSTMCTVFNVFDEIDNEGFETAIDNLGPEYRDPLMTELHRVGLSELADLFHQAWQTHAEGPAPDEDAFETITSRLGELIDDDDNVMNTIHSYLGANGHLFEASE